MTNFWQNLIALTLTAAAAIYVAWRLRHAAARRTPFGCGACCGCQAPKDQEQLVTLEPPPTK